MPREIIIGAKEIKFLATIKKVAAFASVIVGAIANLVIVMKKLATKIIAAAISPAGARLNRGRYV